MSNTRDLLTDLVQQLAEKEEAARPVPTPSPPGEHRRLCVGLSTYDDFDGVYFTIQAARLYHPEVLDRTSFLIIDNHPEGAASTALKGFAESIPNGRYVPFRGYRSTAVRDLIFRDADSDIVLCVDSHVLLAPGAIAALLDFFDAHPESLDLVQGPLVDDGLSHVIGSHFSPKWGAGMFGQWDTDERVNDPRAETFEIDMQGLGVFACRRDAWPGINPRFRGFGGEEGYLHEKFRKQGGRVLCLPALRWAHRFARPMGIPYRPTWEDRVRNYRIGWAEVGWDPTPMEDHFRDLLQNPEVAERMLGQIANQVANPFTFFDGIFCLNLDTQVDRWEAMERRFKLLDIAWRVERFPALVASGSHHHGYTLSLRAMIAEADRRGYANVLLIEDDAVFLDQTLPVLQQALDDACARPWDLLYLGGCVWGQSYPFADGSKVLQIPTGLTCTHAVAVNHTAYARLLDELPSQDDASLDTFMSEYVAADQYLPRRIGEGAYKALVMSPRVASQLALTSYANSDLVLRDRYII